MKDSPAATALFFSEAEINLARAGFSVEKTAAERLAVHTDGSLLCEVTTAPTTDSVSGLTSPCRPCYNYPINPTRWTV